LAPTPEQAFHNVRPIPQTGWDSFAQAVGKFKVEARKRLSLLEKPAEQGALALRPQRPRCEPACSLALVDQSLKDAIRSTFSKLFFAILFPRDITPSVLAAALLNAKMWSF
jgi:hypothetical protein